MSIKYEDIFLNLQAEVEAFKRYYSKHIDECVEILNSSETKVNNQENRFIPTVIRETAMKRFERIKNSYTNFEHIKGEMGTINSTDQYDAIKMMCFSALVSNRITKILESNEGIPKKEIRRYYRKKNESITNILANIYVLEHTDEFYKDFFSYGNREDENGKNTFTIDLPETGSISFHYGNNDIREYTISIAKQKTSYILKRKYELGQLSEEKLTSLLDEINNEGVLPEYSGELYEKKVAFPIPLYDEDPIVQKLIKKYSELCGIKGILPEKITEENLMQVVNYNGLNDREKNYMLIKLGILKPEIETFRQLVRQRDGIVIDVSQMGKKFIIENTPAEIDSVGSTINRNLQNQIAKKNMK